MISPTPSFSKFISLTPPINPTLAFSRKVYHVRAVTQTDVVRAGTRDVAKIFQILYDVDAVSGPGSITYLGGNGDVSVSNGGGGGKRVNNSIFFNSTANDLNSSPRLNNSSPRFNNSAMSSNHSNNSTLSTTILHNDNFSDSAISSTIRSQNGGGGGNGGGGVLDDHHSTGRLNPDAISVGSNDSGEVNVNVLHLFFVVKFLSLRFIHIISY